VIRLIQNELYKTFRLKKMYIFIAILIIHACMTVYFYQSGGEWKSVIVTPNGQSLPLALINSMAQFMTIFIPVYVADLITGDIKAGTFKLTLLRPVGRIEWLNAKIASLFVFILVLVVLSLAAEYAIGTLSFGWGEYTFYVGEKYTGAEGVWLTLGLTFSMLLPYMACGMIVVLFAVMATNISTTIGLSIGILTAAQSLNAFEKIKPYSVVNHMYYFHEIVLKATWDAVFQNTAIIAAYIVLFYAASALIIKKKDLIQ